MESVYNEAQGHLRQRIAVYTHDTFGLGHVRRCMHIIRQLSRELPQAAIMLVTGSPALEYLNDLPPNVDIVKIPTVVKTGAKGSLPPHIPLGLPEMTHIRSRIINEAVLAFSPDVFIVDNFPLGAQAELLQVLQALRPLHTRTILGLRDILDGPEVVRSDWRKQGVYDVIDRYYDKVLVYGVQEIFDVFTEYKIPEPIRKKVHYCGYLTATDDVPELSVDYRAREGIDGPFILATGGGGGDAYPLLSTLIEASAQIPNSHTMIFTGPLMGTADRQLLVEQVNGNPRIKIREFVKDLRPYIRESDVLVSMCGYNIASEIVYHRANAVISPRTWRFGEHANRKMTSEEKEQILRARMLAQYGLVQLIEPEELNSQALVEKISHLLKHPTDKKLKAAIAINGLKNAVAHIREYAG